MGYEIAEHRTSFIPGTLLAGGTLSAEIDIAGWSQFGLITDANLVNSTLSWQVSRYSDNDSVNASDYVDLVNADGSTAGYGPTGSQIAVSGDDVTLAIAPYRYVKLKSAATQTNGVLFYIPVKA